MIDTCLEIRIWDDEEEGLMYSVIRPVANDDPEVLAYGLADNLIQAKKMVLDAIRESI